jgi:hypothetical protein
VTKLARKAVTFLEDAPPGSGEIQERRMATFRLPEGNYEVTLGLTALIEAKLLFLPAPLSVWPEKPRPSPFAGGGLDDRPLSLPGEAAVTEEAC